MRLNYLNLRAIGHFTDYELVFDPAKSFHLIYGPNEAGKSTTLRSISHFLYGFPSQTSDSFLHSNSKLRVEGQLENSKGERLEYIRRKGIKNTVLDRDGNSIDEESVLRFLNGMSDSHFKNMFALDHVRLREGGESLLQSGGNMGESLFSAASGVNMLRKVFENLEKKSGEIYKKRASTTKLNKLLKEEKDLLKEISEYQLKIQAWKELERIYNRGKEEIEELRLSMRTLRSKQERLQRIKHTLPKIARLRDLEEKRKQIGEIPSLPEDISKLRIDAQIMLEESLKDRKMAETQLLEIEEELKSFQIPEGLLNQAVVIDSLYRELQSYQSNLSQIPILEGEKRQLEDRVLSFLKEMSQLDGDTRKMEDYRLSVVMKETIRELCKQKPLIDHELNQNHFEWEELLKNIKDKEEELLKLENLPDIEELENTIKIVREAGNLEELIDLLFVEQADKQKQLSDELRMLPLWDGSYQDLIALEIPPLKETVKKFGIERSEILQKKQKLLEQIQYQKEAIDRNLERIRILESQAEIPSENQLRTVREHREHGWRLIKTKLQNGTVDDTLFASEAPLELAYEESVHTADQVADKMRLEAARVGEKNKLLVDIENSERKITELSSELYFIEDSFKDWESKWIEVWSPSKINPLSPEEMREWLEKYEKIKMLAYEYDKAVNQASELNRKKENLIDTLRKVIVRFVEVPINLCLQELLSTAERHHKKIQTAYYQKQNLEGTIIESRDKLHFIQVQKAKLEKKLTDWRTNWTLAIAGTSITEATPVNVVEKLLVQYEQGVQAYDAATAKVKQLESLQKQVSFFEERVKHTLQTVDMTESNIELAVNRLYTNLQKAQKDQEAKMNCKERLRRLQVTIKDTAIKIAEAEEKLSHFFTLAKCETIEQLVDIEAMILVKKEYEASIKEIEGELLHLGSGLSLYEITQEAEQVELDSIEGELIEIKHQLDEMEISRSELEQKHGVIKKEFEEKIQGNNTATVIAEQRKESLLAEMANLTEQYIQTKLAAILLQKGIEHYREINQDPILKRASDLFSRLTLHSFEGLKVDYDEKDQPVLMGVRLNGDHVPINGMSDGTTDQLYLSLRIASIEKYGQENESIPFIVDDILVHFDDIRSKESLKILLELSKHNQIIFFTHHARLVDIMKEVALVDDYQLLELNSKEPLLV